MPDRGLLVHASHQDLRAARSILWLRRNRQTYWTSTCPAPRPAEGGPARKPLRGRLIQQLQNPLVGRLHTNRPLARPRLVFQPLKAMVGIAMPPKAENPRLDPNFLGDRSGLRPAAANRTIRARFKSRCNVTGERQYASSTLRSFLERWTSLASVSSIS